MQDSSKKMIPQRSENSASLRVRLDIWTHIGFLMVKDCTNIHLHYLYTNKHIFTCTYTNTYGYIYIFIHRVAHSHEGAPPYDPQEGFWQFFVKCCGNGFCCKNWKGNIYSKSKFTS